MSSTASASRQLVAFQVINAMFLYIHESLVISLGEYQAKACEAKGCHAEHIELGDSVRSERESALMSDRLVDQPSRQVVHGWCL